jgi:hypothetical protein
LSVISFTFFISFLSSLDLLFHTSLHFVKCGLLLVVAMLLVEQSTSLLRLTASKELIDRTEQEDEVVNAYFCLLSPARLAKTLCCSY